MQSSAILALLTSLAAAGDFIDLPGPIKYTTYPYAETGVEGYGIKPLREYQRRSLFENNLNDYILNPKHTDDHLIKTVIPEYQPIFSQRLKKKKQEKPVVAKDVKPHVVPKGQYSYPHHDAVQPLKVYPVR